MREAAYPCGSAAGAPMAAAALLRSALPIDTTAEREPTWAENGCEASVCSSCLGAAIVVIRIADGFEQQGEAFRGSRGTAAGAQHVTLSSTFQESCSLRTH